MAATKKRKKSRARAVVARTTPRRRARRKYRRNPPTGRTPVRRQSVAGQLTDLATGGAAGIAGMAVGQFALTKIAPSIVAATDSATTAAFKRFAIGAGLAGVTAVMGPRVMSRRLAEAAALGMLLPALKDVAVALAPEAATYLGRSDFERTFPGRGSAFAGYSRPALSGYSDAPTVSTLADFSPGGFSRSPFQP